MAEALFRPATIVDCMIRLHRSDDVKLGKTLEIFRCHVLRVFDRKALVVIAVFFFDFAEDIEHHGNRAVADRVHAHLQSCDVSLH